MLSQSPWGESDRIYNILTRDLGLVRATALGVRKEASKLRGALEPLTLSRISLVRGKEFWRITSSEVIQIFEPIETILRPLKLLEKLVQGESAHPELFDAVIDKLKNFVPSDEAETRLVAEILIHLGYLKKDDINLSIKELIKAINAGLEASHLISRV